MNRKARLSSLARPDPAAYALAGGRRNAKPSRARYRKLKPGPGRTAEEVAADQRRRIHAATIELVAERGFAGLTASGIVRTARISKHTFYEHFDNKEDCFLASYDQIVRCAAREALAARGRERDQRKRLRSAFAAFAREVAENPRPARLVLRDVFAAWPTAFERMRHTDGLFEALVTDSFAGDGDGAELPPLVVKGVVEGIAQVARARLLAARERDLPREADSLMEWALSFPGVVVDDLEPAAVPSALAACCDGGADVELRRPDERALILSAAARLASAGGYARLSIRRICEAAGLSQGRFATHFDSAADCFAALLELYAGEAIALATRAYASASGWPEGIHRGLTALCAYYAANPDIAKLSFVEIFRAGDEGVKCRARMSANAAALFRHSAPLDQRPTEVAAEASVGAVWGVVHHYVVAGQARQLPSTAPSLSLLALAPAIGARAAARAILAERARSRQQASEPALRA